MHSENGNRERKTLVGILASHDSVNKNNEVARVFEELCKEDLNREKEGKRRLLDSFHFVFTGGTFRRLVLHEDTEGKCEGEETLKPIDIELCDFIKKNSTCLPDRSEGGVTVLADLVVQRQCCIVWSFFSPVTVHWLGPENLALMRLCDIWNAKRLMNAESVRAWFRDEAERDTDRNRQPIPIEISFGPDTVPGKPKQFGKDYYGITVPDRERHSEEWWHDFSQQTIAMIAHDEMKSRMVDFVIQYEHELCRFQRILATGATAQELKGASNKLSSKVMPCLPGPKGGDIEIATAILFNKCHIVIFFIDPLRPHPHIEDIRVVFSACMAELKNNEVRMLTNEVQARAWIEEAVRRRRWKKSD